MEIILQAIGVGIILSVFLIGPVFFMLIETSLFKGWKSAIVLDVGVLTADLLCILAAYFLGGKDLAGMIQAHAYLYKIGGFLIVFYGVFMFFSKPQLHLNNDTIVSKNYIKTFFNGFFLNLLNIGVVVFWFVIVSSVVIQFPKIEHFFLYMATILITYFTVDLFKIFLAHKLQNRLTDSRVFLLRKLVGTALIIFGIIIILKGYGYFSEIDRNIEDKLIHTKHL